jgi:hypothetical protein
MKTEPQLDSHAGKSSLPPEHAAVFAYRMQAEPSSSNRYRESSSTNGQRCDRLGLHVSKTLIGDELTLGEPSFQRQVVEPKLFVAEPRELATVGLLQCCFSQNSGVSRHCGEHDQRSKHRLPEFSGDHGTVDTGHPAQAACPKRNRAIGVEVKTPPWLQQLPRRQRRLVVHGYGDVRLQGSREQDRGRGDDDRTSYGIFRPHTDTGRGQGSTTVLDGARACQRNCRGDNASGVRTRNEDFVPTSPSHVINRPQQGFLRNSGNLEKHLVVFARIPNEL